ncbi:MAG: hypothetical protein JXR76_03940 [Deltaproteobacteria bacterium]|nr:hypothetical protein [Deltaproteobacteria bacterium]
MAIIIKQWKVIERALRIPFAVGNAAKSWQQFCRVYVFVSDGDRNTGTGEASPLPGHSPDTLLQCHQALSRFLPRIVNNVIETVQDVEAVSRAFTDKTPAARFALETALLDLLAKAHRIPLWRLFVRQISPVKANALLPSTDYRDIATQFYDDGIRVFKIKVGARNSARTEMQQLHWLRETFGDTIDIRLDANGTLAGQRMSHKLAAFAPFCPEFIEEPAPFETMIPSPLPIPFAFDESLVHLKNIHAITMHPSCNALVLKPSLLGGFFKIHRLAQFARQHRLKIIVTHMYESLPGYLAAVHLAASIRTESACGLFPHPALGPIHLDGYIQRQGEMLRLKECHGLGISASTLTHLIGASE